MGVARAWSRSEMGKFLPSLSVNFIIYLQNVWSAMSLSLLVPEEKKLQISINFQKSVYPLYICITALASATGEKDTPRSRGAKPPDSIEQGAKPPVRWKVEKRDARKTFSKELKTCQRCYTRLCKLWKSGIWKTNFRRELRLETLQFLPLVYV